MWDSTCTRYVLIETVSDRIEQLPKAFNEAAVNSPFPATLGHIAAVPGQRSDTDRPILEIAAR
jgi:hypothetical protein